MPRIPVQSGLAFRLEKGQVLTVIDPYGGQVSDLMAYRQLKGADVKMFQTGKWDNYRLNFHDADPTSYLSSGRSIDFGGKIYFTTGDILYSNESVPMLTIVEDTCGVHDFLHTPCSQGTFDILYPNFNANYHPSCLENLWKPLSEHGIAEWQIPITFNIFMNVRADENGKTTFRRPTTKPGDYIKFKAELDLVVGLTSCSSEICNDWTLTPIDFQIGSE